MVFKYTIDTVNETELLAYLEFTHAFLKKPIHVGIQDLKEFTCIGLPLVQSLFDDSNSYMFVAKYENSIIAYTSFNIHPALHLFGNECICRELYVAEKYRRKKVGSSLVKKIKETALENNCKRISLVTNLQNISQNNFYLNFLEFQRRGDFLTNYI